jgi:hypothetical protein
MSGGSADAERYVQVYRVVDDAELSWLALHGDYGSNPSQSGKYFALTLEGARAFASAPMNANARITATRLPEWIVSLGRMFRDPGFHGGGRSVFFPQAKLFMVYASMTPPEVLPRENEP